MTRFQETPEAAAKNELLVIEAIAELGTANASQIAQSCGLSVTETHLALRRQQGYCLACSGPNWYLLPEPGSGHPNLQTITGDRKAALTLWLDKQGIQFKEIWRSRNVFYWVSEVAANQINLGDLITIRKGKRRTNRRITNKKNEGGKVALFFKQGVNFACREWNPNELIERHNPIAKTDIDKMIFCHDSSN